MKSAEINTISDLVNKTEAEIQTVPGIGPKRFSDLVAKLKELNLTFKAETEGQVEEKEDKEEPKMEEKVVEQKEEEKEEEKVETVEVVEGEEDDDIDGEEVEDATEADIPEDTEEKETTTKTKYRELQVVEGKVVEVIEAKEGFTRGNRVYKPKPERVLIELEDGSQGYLFRKDTVDIRDDEEFALFLKDNVQVVIKKIILMVVSSSSQLYY